MVDRNSPRAFIIGAPVAHSRSPLVHEHWLRHYKLAGSYTKMLVEPGDLPAFIAELRSSRWQGGNVTIPHKETVLSLLDDVSETALRIGAVNTIWLEGGRLKGDNTDGFGFTANLDAAAPGWRERHGQNAVILGAGGAARAVVDELSRHGFNVTVANRTQKRAANLVGDLAPDARITSLEDAPLAQADFVVNTTSLGMKGEDLPFDCTSLSAETLVTDIVYTPLETPFLKAAKAQGCQTVDGLGMLLHQARPGFQRWFGIMPDVTDALRSEIVADLGYGS